MDPLNLIGIVLFFGGLLIFSFKLSHYNRRKYGPQSSDQTASTSPSLVQMLSLIILALALVIFYLSRG